MSKTTKSTIEIPSAADFAVGDPIPESKLTLDLPTLVRYAGASTDFNPIHYDEAFAKAAGLEGVIGHGLLSMGLISRAVTDWLGDPGLLKSLSVRFGNSARLGDRLAVTGTIAERATGDDGKTTLELRLDCLNQDGVEIIANASATVVLPA
jgi:acyl dehydratase